MPKAKRNYESSAFESQKLTPQTCILHVIGIDHGNFTAFSKIREQPNETLAQLHSVRDKRQAQPTGSNMLNR